MSDKKPEQDETGAHLHHQFKFRELRHTILSPVCLVIPGFPQGHISDTLGFLMQRLTELQNNLYAAFLVAPLSPPKHQCGFPSKLLRWQGAASLSWCAQESVCVCVYRDTP